MAMICPTCQTQNLDSAANCAHCGTVLHDFARDFAPDGSVLPVGTMLRNGQYSLDAILGQGGFGITYRAYDASLRRSVAVKEFFPLGCGRDGLVVRPDTLSTTASYESAKARFIEEAQILARFQHPGIVDVYAVFQENNTAYMVMEYLQGQTLQQLVETRGPLQQSEAVQLITRVGEALAVVHDGGLLHRDIKPENVMVRDDERVVLIDFGTAREFVQDVTRRMTTTVTPGYAPLEQYGRQARFGAFTDIYALGATLYYLLTGQVPTQAPDRIAGIELKAPDQLNSTISRAISDATLWALQVSVSERPQSVLEFVEVLKRERFSVPAPLPTISVAPPSPETVQKGTRDSAQELETEIRRDTPRPAAAFWPTTRRQRLIGAVASAVIACLLLLLAWPVLRPRLSKYTPPQFTAAQGVPRINGEMPERSKNMAELKKSYDSFIHSIDTKKFARENPEFVKRLNSTDMYVQIVGLDNMSGTEKVEAIPWIAPFVESTNSELQDTASIKLKELIFAITLLRHDMGFFTRGAIKPLNPRDPDLRPMAWLILKMLDKSNSETVRGSGALIAGYIGLRELEPELREALGPLNVSPGESSNLRSPVSKALILLALKAVLDEEEDATASAECRAVQAAYNEMNAALGRKDIPAVLSFAAPDYHYTEASGRTYDLASLRSTLLNNISGVSSIESKDTIMKFTLKGNEATAVIHSSSTTRLSQPPAGSPSVYGMRKIGEETWVKSGSKWLVKSGCDIFVMQTIDGQPLRIQSLPENRSVELTPGANKLIEPVAATLDVDGKPWGSSRISAH